MIFNQTMKTDDCYEGAMIRQIEPLIEQQDADAVYKYLNTGGWVTEFAVTRAFEEELAKFFGVKHALVCTSGTAALFIAVSSLDIKFSYVAVPNLTMIAAPNVVRLAQCNPQLVDICSNNLCMDISKINKPVSFSRRSDNIKAMIYTPLNGRSGNMADVVSFCRDNNIFLIEDACQAFGSKQAGKYLGTFGDIGVFSLTPHKLITTGQGGVLVTDDDVLYNRMVKIKDFGRVSAGVDVHDTMGYNFKFTDLQATLGLSQLKTIAQRIEKKKQILAWYTHYLEYGSVLPFGKQNVPWFIDIIVPTKEDRCALMDYLRNENIGSRVFYPPISSQAVYEGYHGGGVSQDISYRGLWLPSSLSLTEDQVAHICACINAFGSTK